MQSLTERELEDRELWLCRQSRTWLFERHFTIQDKEGRIRLMSPLYVAQRKTLAVIEMLRKAHEPVRIIVGKSRKRGMSHLVAADCLAEVIERGVEGMMIAHDRDLSEYLLAVTQRYYDNLDAVRPGIPPIPKPPLFKGQTNKGVIRFEQGGQIYIATANNIYAGTGKTPHYLFCTEGSRWGKGSDTAANLFQAIANKSGTAVIHESIFNGYDSLFLPMWEEAYKNSRLEFDLNEKGEFEPKFTVTNEHAWNGYVPIFHSVLDDPDCWNEFSSANERQAFVNSLDPYEQHLARDRGALPERLKGLRMILKFQCRGDEPTRKEHYPVTPEEAIRASTRSRFSHAFLDRQPIEDGEKGTLAYSDTWDRRIHWMKDDTSPLIRFRDPHPNHRYVIGVDVAEGKLDDNGREADATVCSVHDCDQNLEQVAVLYGQDISEDAVIAPLVLLAEYYNGAFVVVESNSMGKHTAIEMGKRYPQDRLYHRDDWSEKSRMSREIGWRTTVGNKAILIGGLAEVMSSNQIVIRCAKSVSECRGYVKLKGGGTGAESGYHDDHVIALCLAVQGAKSYPARLMPHVRRAQGAKIFRRTSVQAGMETRNHTTGY